MRWLAFLILALVLSALGGWFALAPPRGGTVVTSATSVHVPPLGGIERAGEKLYAENCQGCHGPNGTGTDKGPPFVHIIYSPRTHSDSVFLLAVRRGVRAHHWAFGDMPAQPQVNNAEAERIIAYLRALQAANGIQ